MTALADCDCGYSGALGESHAFVCSTVEKCRLCHMRLDLSSHTMTCPRGTGRWVDRRTLDVRKIASRGVLLDAFHREPVDIVQSDEYKSLTCTIAELARHPPSCICGITSDVRSKHHSSCPKSRSG